MTKLICVAGGSGSGKSTLADALVGRLGEDRASILRLDDFQKTKEAVPMAVLSTEPRLRRNYDHPSAVDFDRFIDGLAALKSGKDVAVPRRFKTASMEEGVMESGRKTVAAKPFVIVEGYLALHDPGARALYDTSIFLRASRETRVARRRWVKDQQYVGEVLLPMHDYFVEPSAAHAALVIDIDDLSPGEVCTFALAHISAKCA